MEADLREWGWGVPLLCAVAWVICVAVAVWGLLARRYDVGAPAAVASMGLGTMALGAASIHADMRRRIRFRYAARYAGRAGENQQEKP